MFNTNTKKRSYGPATSTSFSCVNLPAWVYAKPEPEAHTTTPQAPVDATDLLTRAEVARYLRVSDRTVSRLIRAGQLPAARIGRAVRIRQSDLLDMLNGKPSISDVLGTYRE